MKCFAVLLALVITVFTQPTPVLRRCYESPPQWSGYYREINYDAGPGQVAFRFANISYDRTVKKIKVVEFERKEGDERMETLVELTLYNEQTRYVIEEGKCTKRSIQVAKFPDFGVGSIETFYGVDYLGAEVPGLGVKVDQFHYFNRTRGSDYHGSYAPLSAENSRECIPVIDSYVNTESRLPSQRKNVQITFFNLTTVLDVGAFDIPKICETL